MRLKVLTLCAGLLACSPLLAQFNAEGTDPGRLKWMSIQTTGYNVIYPQGLDSLAREYAIKLEKYAPAVANTIGMMPTDNYRKKFPVILHSFNATSNGGVYWTPRRMELITSPSAYAPEATPWDRHLILHESRHASQMQYSAGRPFRWANILTGQIAPGLLSNLYGGNYLLEGDAVVTETALTDAGRGRTADFMEFYRVSFGNGDMRNFNRWRFGSLRQFTPDYYRAGYLLTGGIRAYYDCPDFTSRFYNIVTEHKGFILNSMNRMTREATGMKLKDAFADVSRRIQEEWEADDAVRAPFMPSRRISAIPSYYQDYSALEIVQDRIYAVRSGLTDAEELVEMDLDGKILSRKPFAYHHSMIRLNATNGMLYWSEYANDPRWEQAGTSGIRYAFGTEVKHSLTKGHNYFNPAPSADGTIAVAEYQVDTRSSVVLLDTVDGSAVRSFPAPAGMQVVEPVWIGRELYASAITSEGSGIYRVDGWELVLDARSNKVKELWEHDGKIMFTSDLSGVNELYALDPSDGKVLQMTNTRFGASSFRFDASGSNLYYASPMQEGRLICCTGTSDLPVREADFTIRHRYPIADQLSAAERPLEEYEAREVEVSAPKPYSKLGHSIQLHSWAPAYIDYDVISNLSFDDIFTQVGLGATAFFQNNLSSFYGMLGYHAGLSGNQWRHSGHANFLYSGWYPVIEGRVDFNDRDAIGYVTEGTGKNMVLKSGSRGVPLAQATLGTYVPLRWNRGGWTLGIIPRARMTISNDSYLSMPLGRAIASVNTYAVQRTPKSRFYPKFGGGLQMGYGSRLWASSFLCSNAYATAYVYLPGIGPTHGLRISGLYVNRFNDGMYAEALVSAAPRGFNSRAASSMAVYKNQKKVSFDYAIPFGNLQWDIPLFYVKNLEFIMHGDYTDLTAVNAHENLYSAGADFCVKFGCIPFFPYDTRIGVSYNYNNGSFFDKCLNNGSVDGHHTFSLIFTVDL